ncbi:MAG: A/G-specific adenine glycosylase [bacterium]|nr:A/G-specific adenine glycosylase [bacterium]
MLELLRHIKQFYKKERRGHLPWRNLPAGRQGQKDPYKILVSEIMLQQTQVDRVIPFYIKFIKAFPTTKILAQVPLSKVLKQWQGLGYNRRAKFLHQAAKILVREGFIGQKLPGVGPYTAGAIGAFAFNKPEIFIETNIRTVFLHWLDISGHSPARRRLATGKVADIELLPLVAEALKKSKMQPRDFYAALMDYGAHLKAQGIKLNFCSKHYTKQSKFEGSVRQLRGQIIKLLLQKPHTESDLIYQVGKKKKEVKKILVQLQKENMISYKNKKFEIAKY